jgi:ferredoxin
MKDTLSFLTAAGIPQPQIQFEAFGSQQFVAGAKTPHLPKENDGAGPMITFVKSYLSFRWQTRFGSLLEAAEACDVNVKWSCRAGVCHRCESNLLNGDVQYSPQPLDPAARGNILLCCAKPVSDVQIDL